MDRFNVSEFRGVASRNKTRDEPSSGVNPAVRINRDVVVMGAALGGIDALCTLLASLPEAFPAALLMVLHSESCSTGLLLPRLQDHCLLPVAYAQHGDDIRPGRVYLSCPDRHLSVQAPGVVELDSGPRVLGSRPAADRLFESAADCFGSRVIGVVLSGSDQDGTAGLCAIKAAGGLCIVQHPADATAPGMPMHALAGDHPDFCVKLNVMGALLTELVFSNKPTFR